MKTVLKIATIVIGSLALIIGGYVLYIAKFKEYDVADTEVDEIVREPYVIELPDGGTLEIEEDGTVTEKDAEGNILTVSQAPEDAESTVVASNNSSSADGEENSDSSESGGSSTGSTGTTNSGTSSNGGSGSTGGSGSSGSGSSGSTGGSGSSGSDSSGSGSSGSSGSTGGSGSSGSGSSGSTGGSGSSGSGSGSGSGTSTGGSSETSTMTVSEIKTRYNPVFAGLEAQAEERLNALVSRAKAEYATMQANGESIDYGYFYRKYSAAAANLEASTDAAFYSTLAVVQNVFVANGFNKSYAADYETQYKERKAERRSELMSQVTGG